MKEVQISDSSAGIRARPESESDMARTNTGRPLKCEMRSEGSLPGGTREIFQYQSIRRWRARNGEPPLSWRGPAAGGDLRSSRQQVMAEAGSMRRSAFKA